MLSRRTYVVMIVILLAGITLLFGRPAQSSDVDTKTLIIAGDENYPPFEFEDSTSFRGFNVDVVRSAAHESNLTIEYVPMNWTDALAALDAGEVDALQGMIITEERKQKYDFSDPYLVQEQALFVPANNQTIHSLADLQDKRVAVQANDVCEQIAYDLDIHNIIAVADQAAAFELLGTQQVDAVLGNHLTGLYWGQQPGNYGLIKVIGEPFGAQPYALAVPKGHTDVLNVFNDGLKEIQADGTYDKIQKAWFGQIVSEPPLLSNSVIKATVVAGLISVILGIMILAWNRTLRRQIHKSTFELAQKNKELKQSYLELDIMVEHIIYSFGQLVEARDYYTKHHSDRVAHYAYEVALDIGIDEETASHIFRAGLLHDIGKVGIPENILNKNGPLTTAEFTMIKKHPQQGYAFLQDIPNFSRLGINDIILQHHERWDGKGYPHGLSGNQITLGARILSIADSWDAMTSSRAYRTAMPLEKAILELQRGAGTQFDPSLVDPFIDHILNVEHNFGRRTEILKSTGSE